MIRNPEYGKSFFQSKSAHQGQKKIICMERSSILVLMGCFQLGKQSSIGDVSNFGVGSIIVLGSVLPACHRLKAKQDRSQCEM